MLASGAEEALVLQMNRCRMGDIFALIPYDLPDEVSQKLLYALIRLPVHCEGHYLKPRPPFLVLAVEALYTQVKGIPASLTGEFLKYAAYWDYGEWVEPLCRFGDPQNQEFFVSALEWGSFRAAAAFLKKGCDPHHAHFRGANKHLSPFPFFWIGW